MSIDQCFIAFAVIHEPRVDVDQALDELVLNDDMEF